MSLTLKNNHFVLRPYIDLYRYDSHILNDIDDFQLCHVSLFWYDICLINVYTTTSEHFFSSLSLLHNNIDDIDDYELKEQSLFLYAIYRPISIWLWSAISYSFPEICYDIGWFLWLNLKSLISYAIYRMNIYTRLDHFLSFLKYPTMLIKLNWLGAIRTIFS